LELQYKLKGVQAVILTGKVGELWKKSRDATAKKFRENIDSRYKNPEYLAELAKQYIKTKT